MGGAGAAGGGAVGALGAGPTGCADATPPTLAPRQSAATSSTRACRAERRRCVERLAPTDPTSGIASPRPGGQPASGLKVSTAFFHALAFRPARLRDSLRASFSSTFFSFRAGRFTGYLEDGPAFARACRRLSATKGRARYRQPAPRVNGPLASSGPIRPSKWMPPASPIPPPTATLIAHGDDDSASQASPPAATPIAASTVRLGWSYEAPATNAPTPRARSAYPDGVVPLAPTTAAATSAVAAPRIVAVRLPRAASGSGASGPARRAPRSPPSLEGARLRFFFLRGRAGSSAIGATSGSSSDTLRG